MTLVQTPRRRLSAAALLASVLAVVLLAGACTPQELQLRNLVNNTRISHGLGSLAIADDLNSKAHAQAVSMANQARLAHSDPRSAVSSSWTVLAENVASAGSIQAAHDALMASAGHRANILDGRYWALGTGTVFAQGKWYVVEEFGG
jgi:uncharacterized protein YkwD